MSRERTPPGLAFWYIVSVLLIVGPGAVACLGIVLVKLGFPRFWELGWALALYIITVPAFCVWFVLGLLVAAFSTKPSSEDDP